jgi:dTDP-4-amino-4,6-dideoxygalactose transaminase
MVEKSYLSTTTIPTFPRIDFNKPELTGKELVYIKQAIENTHISGDGRFTKLSQALLEQELGVPRIFLTTSCTHALELAALLLDLRPEDEVIVPSFTFVSTINAFVLRGVRPVFIDIRPDTLNMDETLLEGLITPRTRVILPVHYAGVACEMDVIMDIARGHNIHVVEDNAHGLFGHYRGKNLGTFGCLSTLSFHETKNITCGEGGALLVNDPDFIERAEILREKGTNRSRFFRGQVDKYTWIDVGSSYLPSDILAAFLYAQLEVRLQIQAKRKRVWEYYNTHLKDWADKNDVCLPFIPPHCNQPYHMFYMILPSLQARHSLIAYLNERGIQSVFHYLPLHISKMGLNYGGKLGDCPVTERVSDCLLRLPFYNNLTESDQSQIVEAIQEFKF